MLRHVTVMLAKETLHKKIVFSVTQLHRGKHVFVCDYGPACRQSPKGVEIRADLLMPGKTSAIQHLLALTLEIQSLILKLCMPCKKFCL